MRNLTGAALAQIAFNSYAKFRQSEDGCEDGSYPEDVTLWENLTDEAQAAVALAINNEISRYVGDYRNEAKSEGEDAPGEGIVGPRPDDR